MWTPSIVVPFLSLCSISLAVPAPSPVTSTPARLEDRQLLGNLLGAATGILGNAVSDLDVAISDIEAGSLVGTAGWSAIKTALSPVTATATQTDVASAISTLSLIHSARPSANFYEFVASVVAEGLTTDSVSDALSFVNGGLTGENSMNNVNPAPSQTIYPAKACGDATYSVPEETLRGAIYIPSGFTYGAKPPVILMPGTGNTGYITFQGNFIQLLTGVSYADPVWLNIPGYLLDDAQKNSEFIAYAINYINSVSNNANVSVIAWSQGNINTQWAFKYWPSTRQVTSDHIAISADYAGTVNANAICPDGLPCDPSVLQQQYLTSSNFITTLRNNNGDSGYVPTTVLYSAFFDEIVQPQEGTGASAFLNDVRGVGVTNNEVQTVCSGLPGGSFYTHEGMLYNPLSFALAVDALTHDGPGLVSRIDTTTVCNQYLATGLNLGDLLLTENIVVVASSALILYEPKVIEEPAISAYALASSSTCAGSTTTAATSLASTLKTSTTSSGKASTSTNASTNSSKSSSTTKTKAKTTSTTTKKTSTTSTKKATTTSTTTKK